MKGLGLKSRLVCIKKLASLYIARPYYQSTPNESKGVVFRAKEKDVLLLI